MTADLYPRIRAAIEGRLELAQAAVLDWPSIIGIVEGSPPFIAPDRVHDFIAANHPAWAIRALEADLSRLDRHAANKHRECDVCVADSSAYTYDPRPQPWPCPEVQSLALVYLEEA